MVIIGYGVACGGVGLVTGLVGQTVLSVMGRMGFFFCYLFVILVIKGTRSPFLPAVSQVNTLHVCSPCNSQL